MRVALLMTSGRTKLSIQLTASRPQRKRPMPATVWLVISSQMLAPTHTTGVTNGISAAIMVSAPSAIGAFRPATQ